MKSALARQGSISRLHGPRNIKSVEEMDISRKRITKSVTFDKTDEIIQYITPTPEITEENWDQYSLESCDSDQLDTRPLPVIPAFSPVSDLGTKSVPSPLEKPLGDNQSNERFQEDFDFALKDASDANFAAMDAINMDSDAASNSSAISAITESKRLVTRSIVPNVPTPELSTTPYTAKLLPSPIQSDFDPSGNFDAVMQIRSKHKHTDSELSNFSDYGSESHFPIHKQQPPKSPETIGDGESTWRDERSSALARQDSLQDSQRTLDTQQISPKKPPPPEQNDTLLGRTYSKRRTKLLQILDPQGAGTATSSTGFRAIPEEDEEAPSVIENIAEDFSDETTKKALSDEDEPSTILSVTETSYDANNTIGISSEPAARFVADNMTFTSFNADKSDNTVQTSNSFDIKANEQSSPKLIPLSPRANDEENTQSIAESFDFSISTPREELANSNLNTPLKPDGSTGKSLNDNMSPLVTHSSGTPIPGPESNSRPPLPSPVPSAVAPSAPMVVASSPVISDSSASSSEVAIPGTLANETKDIPKDLPHTSVDVSLPSNAGSIVLPHAKKSSDSLRQEQPHVETTKNLKRDSGAFTTTPAPVKRHNAFPGVLPWDPSFDTTVDNLAMMAIPTIPQKSPNRSIRSLTLDRPLRDANVNSKHKISEIAEAIDENSSDEWVDESELSDSSVDLSDSQNTRETEHGHKVETNISPMLRPSNEDTDQSKESKINDDADVVLRSVHSYDEPESDALLEEHPKGNKNFEVADHSKVENETKDEPLAADTNLIRLISEIDIDSSTVLPNDETTNTLRKKPSFTPITLPKFSPMLSTPFVDGLDTLNPLDVSKHKSDSAPIQYHEEQNSSSAGGVFDVPPPPPAPVFYETHHRVASSMADNSILKEMSFSSEELAEFQQKQRQLEQNASDEYSQYNDYVEQSNNHQSPMLDSELSDESIFSEDGRDTEKNIVRSGSNIDDLAMPEDDRSVIVHPSLDEPSILAPSAYDNKRASGASMRTANTSLDDEVASIREPSFGENMASTLNSLFPDRNEFPAERSNYTVRESNSYVIATSPQRRVRKSTDAYEVLNGADEEAIDIPYQAAIPRRPMPETPSVLSRPISGTNYTKNADIDHTNKSNFSIVNFQGIPFSKSSSEIQSSSKESTGLQSSASQQSTITSSISTNAPVSNNPYVSGLSKQIAQPISGVASHSKTASDASVPSTISRAASSNYSLVNGGSASSSTAMWWAKSDSQRLAPIAEPAVDQTTDSSAYSTIDRTGVDTLQSLKPLPDSVLPSVAAKVPTVKSKSPTFASSAATPSISKLIDSSTTDPADDLSGDTATKLPPALKSPEFGSTIFASGVSQASHIDTSKVFRKPDKIDGLLYLKIEGITLKNLPGYNATLSIDNGMHCITTKPVPANSMAGLEKEYRIGLISNEPARITLRLSSNDSAVKPLKELELGADGSLAQFDIEPLRKQVFGRSQQVEVTGLARWSSRPKSAVSTLYARALYIPCVSMREHAPGTLESASERISAARNSIQGKALRMSGILRQYGGDTVAPSGKKRYVVLDPVSPLLVIHSSRSHRARTLVNLAKATNVIRVGPECLELQFKNKDSLAFRSSNEDDVAKWIRELKSAIGSTLNIRPKWIDAILYESHD